MVLNKEHLLDVWEKGTVVKGYPENRVRKDDCGAYIIFDFYEGGNEYFAWEIDHIIPRAILERNGVPKQLTDHLINLRPLNRLNNKSKGISCPNYTIAITSEENANVLQEREARISDETINKILEFYRKEGYDISL